MLQGELEIRIHGVCLHIQVSSQQGRGTSEEVGKQEIGEGEMQFMWKCLKMLDVTLRQGIITLGGDR